MGPPMTFPRAEEPSPALAETVTARIWPNVLLQWEDLGGLPPMRRAAVIGAGSWGTAVAVLLARGGLEVQLGARTPERVEELIEDGENRRYLPGVPLPESIDVRPASAIELAGLDLICLAIPSAQLPQAVGAIADRVSSRSAVLMLTKGLISPAGPAALRVRRRTGAGAGDRLPRRAGPRPRGGLRARPRWSSARPTRSCGSRSARSSTAPASSASARAT